MSHVPVPLRSYRTWLVFHACMFPFMFLGMVLQTLWVFLSGTYYEFRAAISQELGPQWRTLFTNFRRKAHTNAVGEWTWWEDFNADET